VHASCFLLIVSAVFLLNYPWLAGDNKPLAKIYLNETTLDITDRDRQKPDPHHGFTLRMGRGLPATNPQPVMCHAATPVLRWFLALFQALCANSTPEKASRPHSPSYTHTHRSPRERGTMRRQRKCRMRPAARYSKSTAR
jgi:hypothetical protein